MSAPAEATKPDSASTLPFEYAPSLQEYMVPGKEFIQLHPDYNVLCTGICIFNPEGKLLLVQRAADEHAFPNCWEIPGGKVDEPDETLLHAAVRELKEETGLTATRIVRKVTEFGWSEISKKTGRQSNWRKHVFEMEVERLEDLKLDPVEHQSYLWVTEDEVKEDKVGEVQLTYITPPNKVVKLQAFGKRREDVD